MATAKPKMSSATRGNPYGRTGAPGKATETKEDDDDDKPEGDDREVADMMGREPPPRPPGPAEQRLQMAPPMRPQPMPNLQALQQRGQMMQRPPMGGGMPPGMPMQRPPMGMPPQMPPPQGQPGMPQMPPGQQPGMPPPMDPARAAEMQRLRAQYGG